MRSVSLHLAFLALTACSASEIRTLDLTQAPDGVAVVLLLHRDGRASRALPPFGLEKGRVTFGEAPRLFLKPDETRALWLHLDPEALRRQEPRLDMARLAELQVRIDKPPLEPSYTVPSQTDDVQARLRLPNDGLTVFGESGESIDPGGLQLELTLQVWLDPDGCAEPGRTRLKPYAAEGRPLAGTIGADNAEILAAAALDDTHIVVGGLGIAVIAHGQTFVPGPSNWLSPQDLQTIGLGELLVHDIVLQPGLQWPRPALAAVQHAVGGALLELEVGPDDLRLVGTTTITNQALYEIDLNEAGVAAVVGTSGMVLIVDGDGVRNIPLPLLSETLGPDKTHLRWTQDELEPLLANTRGSIHGLNASMTDWSTTEFVVFEQRVRIRSVQSRGSEIWVASNTNTLFRRSGPGTYDSIHPSVGSGMRPCGSGRGGAFPMVNRHITGLALADNAKFLTYRDCSIAVRLREDGCPSSIFAPEAEPTNVEWHHEVVFEYNGQFVVATDRGDLWVSEVE